MISLKPTNNISKRPRLRSVKGKKFSNKVLQKKLIKLSKANQRVTLLHQYQTSAISSTLT